MNVTCFNQTQVGAFGKHQKSSPSRKEATKQYISICKAFRFVFVAEKARNFLFSFISVGRR